MWIPCFSRLHVWRPLSGTHWLQHTCCYTRHMHTQCRPCQQPPNQAKQTLNPPHTTLHYSEAKQAANSKQMACQPRPRPTKKQALKTDIALAHTLSCDSLNKASAAAAEASRRRTCCRAHPQLLRLLQRPHVHPCHGCQEVEWVAPCALLQALAGHAHTCVEALAALLCCVGDAGLALVQLVVLAIPVDRSRQQQHHQRRGSHMSASAAVVSPLDAHRA